MPETQIESTTSCCLKCEFFDSYPIDDTCNHPRNRGKPARDSRLKYQDREKAPENCPLREGALVVRYTLEEGV